MNLRCPKCLEAIDPGSLRCPRSHVFREVNGVLILVDPELEATIGRLSEALERDRERAKLLIEDPSLYAQLPFVRKIQPAFEWRLRRYDWKVVQRLLSGRKGLNVLDVGAFNGWLSHRLAAEGHRVTAVDYFADEVMGLGAIRHYPTRWRAIQMDLSDMSPLDEHFDAIIVNRCLHFLENPVASVKQLLAKLRPPGQLILTGIAFYLDPGQRRGYLEKLCQEFRQQHGLDLFLVPTRGYLDLQDKRRLKSMGFRFRPYLRLLHTEVRRLFDRNGPSHRYGYFEAGHRSGRMG